MEKILNPNCSEVAVRLPLEAAIEDKNDILLKLEKTNLDEETKNKLCRILDASIYEEDGWSWLTDSLDPGIVLDDMLSGLGEWSTRKPDDIPELKFTGDDGGGGGDYDYVEKVYDIARMVAAGHLTREQAEYLDNILWENGSEKAERVDLEIERCWGCEADAKPKL